MSAELDTYRPRLDIVPVADQNVAVDSLMAWARSASAAREIAGHLVNTSFVPAGFRNKPDEATAAILAGLEVGLQPMAALRSFDVIQGIAAPRANTLRAIVQSQGHEIWLVESTDTRAVMAGRRRGSQQAQKSTWTIDRAAKLKLTGKDNWRNQPQAMLVARATSEICRLIASDAIMGLAYSVEEMADGDYDSEPTTTAAVAGPARRTAKRTQAPRAATAAVTRGDAPPVEQVETTPDAPPLPGDEPPQEDTPAAPAASASDSKPVTNAQLTALAAALSFLGITDRGDRLNVCANLAAVGPLDTSKDLTRADASFVLDTLKRISDLPDPETGLAQLVGMGTVERSEIEARLGELEAAS